MADRFDKFTERARIVLQYAHEEAMRLKHDAIRPEHLLLGILRLESGVAWKTLAALGVDPAELRDEIEHLAPSGEPSPAEAIGLDAAAKRAIELAVDEVRQLKHSHVGTEHLLLGVLREGEGVAARALEARGVSLEAARDQVAERYAGLTARYRDRASRQTERYLQKFTERARKVLELAQEEARRFNHNYIGTEHLLLGLVREGEGVAAKVLANMGVELNKVRSSVEFIIGRGDRTVTGEINLTPRARKVVELAADEARRLNHRYIGTEHLLLGLVREGEGIAAGALESLGVSLDKVRSQVIYVLNQSAVYGTGQQPPSATERFSRDPRNLASIAADVLRDTSDDLTRAARRLAESGAQLEKQAEAEAEAADNKKLVQLYYRRVLSKGEVDGIDDLFAPAFASYPRGGELTALEQSVEMLLAAFADLDVEADEQIAEGDRVVTRWTARGTHAGPFLGIEATGKQVTFSGIHIHRIVGGKIAESWEQLDLFGLFQQLGAVPPTEQPGA